MITNVHTIKRLQDLTGVKPEVVRIDNVADHYYRVSRKMAWDIEEYPCIIPPWPCAVYEAKIPRVFNMNGKMTKVPHGMPTGLVVYAWRKPCDNESVLTKDPVIDMMDDVGGKHGPVIVPEHRVKRTRELIVACGRYEVAHAMVHVVYLRSPLLGKDPVPFCVFGDYVDSEGKAHEDMPRMTLHSAWVEKQDATAKKMSLAIARDQLHLIYYANSLMHCKNTSFNEVTPPPKLARRRIKRGKHPGITYKTLAVASMASKRASNVGKTSTNASLTGGTALHIRRGHFKDYRSGKGLFGRYKGLYWWDMIVAGTDEDRQIIKEYELNPENQP